MRIRQSSSTRAFEDLPVERCYGELVDDAALREAMRGVDTVYYCVVVLPRRRRAGMAA